MKKLLLITLLLCGCVASERQDHAQHVAERYIRSIFNNPKYLVSVSFTGVERRRYQTALDTTLNYANIKSDDNKRIHKYVDSENEQRPDLQNQNIQDRDYIERGKLTYYTIDYCFRIDAAGQKKLKRYR